MALGNDSHLEPSSLFIAVHYIFLLGAPLECLPHVPLRHFKLKHIKMWMYESLHGHFVCAWVGAICILKRWSPFCRTSGICSLTKELMEAGVAALSWVCWTVLGQIFTQPRGCPLGWRTSLKIKWKHPMAMKTGSRFTYLGHDKIGRQFKFCQCCYTCC